MMRTRSKHPTELELQILKVIWETGPAPVREVREALAKMFARDLAHTTVVTTLNTMVKKKYLGRQERGNAYIFRALTPREKVSQGILHDLVDQLFDGSAVSLMNQLLKAEEVTPRERLELRKLIDRYRQKGEKR